MAQETDWERAQRFGAVAAFSVALARCPRCENRFYVVSTRFFWIFPFNPLRSSRCAHCGLDLAHAR